jgi:hypothetical protein
MDLFLIFLFFFLGWLAYTDFKYGELSNSIIYSGIIFFLILKKSLILIIISLVLFFIISYTHKYYKDYIAGGDTKLLLLLFIGLFGIPGIFTSTLFLDVFCFSGIFMFIYAIITKKQTFKYAVFLYFSYLLIFIITYFKAVI